MVGEGSIYRTPPKKANLSSWSYSPRLSPELPGRQSAERASCLVEKGFVLALCPDLPFELLHPRFNFVLRAVGRLERYRLRQLEDNIIGPRVGEIEGFSFRPARCHRHIG